MGLVENIKNRFESLKNKPKKLDRLMIIVLSCIVLVIAFVVLLVSYSNIDTSDYLTSLLEFRNLILWGVFLVFGLFVILAIGRVKLEWVFLAVALSLGFLYMLTMTPLSIPDEPFHYVTSLHLSSTMMSPFSDNFTRASDFDFPCGFGHFNVPSGYIRLLNEGIQSTYSYTVPPRNLGYHTYPVQYLPQAIGVSLARLLGLNFLGLFYFGRFFNLLFFVLCGFFAIRALDEFKLPLLIIGILPMTLHQAASFSPDSFINGASLLLIAYIIRFIYQKDDVRLRDIVIMACAAVLLAPAKTVYTFIVLLVFFALPYKYGWKNAKGYLIAFGIFAIAVANIMLFNLLNLVSTLEPSDMEAWHGGVNYNVSFIIEHPWLTIWVFLNTIRVMGLNLFYGMFGHILSGLSLVLPLWYIYVFIFILFASIFYGKKDSFVPSWPQRAWFAVICACVVLARMLDMFLGWTPYGSPIILGLQGRYFIPILPLAALILRSKLKLNAALYPYILIAAAICVHFLILRFVLDYTISLL